MYGDAEIEAGQEEREMLMAKVHDFEKTPGVTCEEVADYMGYLGFDSWEIHFYMMGKK